MVEPLSLAASIAGITVPALHVVHIVLNDSVRVEGAPKTTRRLTEETKAFTAVLGLLEEIEHQE
jgi:hypothetical protein